NIALPSRTKVSEVFDASLDIVIEKTISYPIKEVKPVAKKNVADNDKDVTGELGSEKEIVKKDEKDGFKQISIFDDPE
ncbi:MAG: hypothetical protein GX813_04220, partial [Erysipelotrichia bacterium]|nr:hypothetical protein [Erysipelotrichia bacterium]